MSAVSDGARAGRAWPASVRTGAILVLILFEIVLIDRNYSFVTAVDSGADRAWAAFNTALKHGAYIGLYAAGALALLTWAAQHDLAGRWREWARTHRWGRWLAAQSALFAVVFAGLLQFQNPAAQAPWAAFILWLCAAGAMAACAGLTAAPAQAWLMLARRPLRSYALALALGGATHLLVGLSQDSWDGLSAATMYAAHALLTLYEPAVFFEPAQRLLGAGEFKVAIYAACSGYEGVGLVVSMLGAYVLAFRRDLRFPHALALLPIGAVTIWLLNAARIALLISLGAHVSPDFALNGFHSQAGWVLFVVVTISLMALAHGSKLFRAARTRAAPNDPGVTLAAAMLAPFAALMAARIAGAMAGEEAYWIGAAAIGAPAAALWFARARIGALVGAAKPDSIVIGLIVGVLWIATERAGGAPSALGPWLESQEPAAAAGWLALRVLGFALIVPIAEELAFRGYLHRALVARRFERAPAGAFSWTAFIATSLLFGAMHGRWMAGALAGAAFAVALYRSKSLAGPITAHIAANALIAAYALATAQWALL